MEALLWIVGIVWGATATFYLLFMVFASYHTARRAGRPIPVLTYVFIGPPILFGYFLDICWNATLGSLMFWELPRALTFTERLQSHKNEKGWRGKMARYWASLLNPFDVGHV